MSLFISEAYAAAPAGPEGASSIVNIIMFTMIPLMFYFMIWRAQSKRQKEMAALMGGLKKGDEVVFAGGLLGRIQKVDDEYATVEINDNLTVKIQKISIVSTLPNGTLKSIGQN